MNKAKFKIILSFTILPIAILSVQPYTTLPIGNTTIWWFLQVLILYLFWRAKVYFFDIINTKSMIVIKAYLYYNIFSIIRGGGVAETYWDWKALIGITMALLLPVVAYLATNKNIMQSILTFYFKYTLPLFLVFIPFLPNKGAYGLYLIPISFIIIYLPTLTKPWKIIIILICFFVVSSDLSARSNVIKFSVPLILLFFFFFRKLLHINILKIVHGILILVPIFFFILGGLGIFNVLNMEEYIESDYVELSTNQAGVVTKESLKNDTRTFLYMEVLYSAQKHNYWWFGRSPARGNDTEAFGDWAEGFSGRRERARNEVGILNVFTWTGIIGVVLYFLIFWKASYMAIYKSKNIYSKILGLFVAFRWCYAWAEDINDFALNYLLIWMMIGMCLSHSFRSMNNEEVKLWVRGIFSKRYRLLSFKMEQQRIIEQSKIIDETR